MRKRLTTAALVLALPATALAATPFGSGGKENPTATGGLQTPPAFPVVTKEVIQRPQLSLKKSKTFVPWSRPTPSQVDQIIDVESTRWGAPASRLRCRIMGESTYRWNNSFKGHEGLGQFLPETFNRGISSIGSRKVVRIVTRTVSRPNYVVKTWSDGRVTREKHGKSHVRVTTTFKGKIPSHPEITHGWAQVRIMARAMVGLGRVHDGEWQVRC